MELVWGTLCLKCMALFASNTSLLHNMLYVHSMYALVLVVCLAMILFSSRLLLLFELDENETRVRCVFT